MGGKKKKKKEKRLQTGSWGDADIPKIQNIVPDIFKNKIKSTVEKSLYETSSMYYMLAEH